MIEGVPDYTFSPSVLNDLKKLHNTIKKGSVSSKDMALLFNLKAPTSGGFYERVRTLILYGLIEGRGQFKLTELGLQLADPNSDEQLKNAYRKAIFNIPLWDELYKQHGKSISGDIWIDIKRISGITADEAQKIQGKVKKLYHEDISFLESQIGDIDKTIPSEQNEYSLDYNTIPSLNTQTSTQIRSPNLSTATHEDTRVIPFANMEWRYPSSLNTEDAWNQFKDYMEVYLKYEKKGKKETGKGNAKNQDNVISSEVLPGDVTYPE